MNKKVIFIGLFILLAISTLQSFGQVSRKKTNSDEAQIRAALESTAIGWNEGSPEKYLAVTRPTRPKCVEPDRRAASRQSNRR